MVLEIIFPIFIIFYIFSSLFSLYSLLFPKLKLRRKDWDLGLLSVVVMDLFLVPNLDAK